MGTNLLHATDLLFFPMVLFLFLFFNKQLSRKLDADVKKHFRYAFTIRAVLAVVFSFLMQFYYTGSDTTRFYVSLIDIQKAISDGAIDLWTVLGTAHADINNPLYYYFSVSDVVENQYYMTTTSNFAVPRFGLIPSYILNNSYPAIGLCFSYFTLIGCLKIYQVFSSMYPELRKQIMMVVFFVPTVCFWSSGILKDPLAFGALGFLFHAFFNLFIKREKIISSIIWIIIATYIIYTVKVYILIALSPALIMWIFLQWRSRIQSAGMRLFAMLLMVILFGFLAIAFNSYLVSDENLQMYSKEVVLDAIDTKRSVYSITEGLKGNSYFSLGSDDPILSLPLGVVATYFRPFVWEVRSPIMLLSALESLAFLYITVYAFFKIGIRKAVKLMVKNPLLLFCFVFSLLFGAAVGTSTANFGTLVRYKIPVMPFYLFGLLLLYYLANVPLPKPFHKLLRFNEIVT